MNFASLFDILTQFATQNPVGASITAAAIYDAARGAATRLWSAARGENLFDSLWLHAVDQALADRWPTLRGRVAGIRGAFAEGRIVDADTFRQLLKDAGVAPEIADDLLSRIQGCLRDALLEAARADPRAFPPAVLDELAFIGLMSRESLISLGDMRQRIARMEQDICDIKDGLAHWPREMHPAPVALAHVFTDQEGGVLDHVQAILTEAPGMIDRGELPDAHARLVACRHDIVRLLENLRQRGVPDRHRRPVVTVLARADIQLGTIAFESHQYRVAAEIYHRASDHARDAAGKDTLALAVYQTGVAHAYAREWRLAHTSFSEALRLDPDNHNAVGNLAVVQSELGMKREALASRR